MSVTSSTLNCRVGNDEGMAGLQTYKPQKNLTSQKNLKICFKAHRLHVQLLYSVAIDTVAVCDSLTQLAFKISHFLYYGRPVE